ncbi:spermatogenesis-associated protein 45 [Gracilinanus agilis]|uniref:spermatogenesis-associated protein 45 n=1 Tax=Gracilinanus agilis TaxID=191870 RepID=UPI001CFDF317|nr:spermatogenesis-associated protein 45 [Gracilinanus agilis]
MSSTSQTCSQTDTQTDTPTECRAYLQQLMDINEQRNSWCIVESLNNVTWLRPQKRHYLQTQHMCTTEIQEKITDTGRSSWADLTHPAHREKRHFPERNLTGLSKLRIPSH